MNTINDKLFVCIFQHSRHLQLLDELEEEFDDGPKPPISQSKWSSWSSWSSCSATCGIGMEEGSQMRTRDCIQPERVGRSLGCVLGRSLGCVLPKNDCVGSSVDKRSCITHCVTKPDVTTPATPPDPGCKGKRCPMPVEVDQEIVNFALAELSWGDCHMKQARVENFKYQVKLSDS